MDQCTNQPVSLGWSNAAIQRPSIAKASFADPARCFLSANTTRYPQLPGPINDGLCFGVGFFRELFKTEDGSILAEVFSQTFFAATFIVAYEQLRQPALLAKLGLPLLFIGQFVSAAVVLPLFFAIVAISRKQNIKAGKMSVVAPPSSERVWTALIAAIVGYAVPTRYIATTDRSYDALALWQLFPLYMLALCIILPPILRPFLKNTSHEIPVLLAGIIGIYLSATAHFKMLTAEAGPLSAALPYLFSTGTGLSFDVHHFFSVDAWIVVIATFSQVVLSYESDAEESVGCVMFLVIFTALLGPGAAALIIWSWREGFDYKTPIGQPRFAETQQYKPKPRPDTVKPKSQ
jgi:hypothetical protein